MSDFHERVGTEVQKRHIVKGVQSQPPMPVPEDSPELIRPATTGEKRWAANYDIFWGATQTYDELPAGLYSCGSSSQLGPILIRQHTSTDHLLELPDEASASIVAEFDQFWTLEKAFAARGFLHKRGFMLWGPPGSGKTSTLQLLIKRLIEDRNGIVLLIETPDISAMCLQLVRSIEAKRPIIAVLEDLDALVERHGENEYLALLDGEAQVDKIVFVATTNYPERLDKRFVDRPSRFDTIRYIGMPSSRARRAYLAAKEPSLPHGDLVRWVELSDGFSIAHLKEMIIAVRCFGQELEDVSNRLHDMIESTPKSDRSPDRAGPGFTAFRHHPPSRGGAIGSRNFSS